MEAGMYHKNVLPTKWGNQRHLGLSRSQLVNVKISKNANAQVDQQDLEEKRLHYKYNKNSCLKIPLSRPFGLLKNMIKNKETITSKKQYILSKSDWTKLFS